MEAKLVLHKGARRVEREELTLVPTPPPTETWFPVSHEAVLSTSLERLHEAGYQVRKTALALNKANTQFFGTLDLETTLVPGVTLAVGIRNSTDKSFPMGWCAGNRVFVCDNLAMHSDLLVKREHTRYGSMRFANAITQAVTSLHAFQASEATRVRRMAETGITTERAESLMLRAYLRNIISFKHLHGIEKQWREPAHKEWEPGTLWHLFNAATYVMGETAQRNPNGYANRTMQLNRLLSPLIDMTPQVPALAA